MKHIKALFKPVLFLLLLTLLMLTGYQLRQYIDATVINTYTRSLGVWAPVGFILFYAVATVMFLPGAVLTIAGGFIFGPVLGTVCNLTGAMLGATVAFMIARYFAADWVAQRSGRYSKMLLNGVAKEGWRFVAIVRLIPVIPFNLLNYALGLTSISLTAYVVASTVFMLPGAAAYTYIGSLGQTALAGDTETLVKRVFIALALLIMVALIPYFLKRYGKSYDID